MTLYADAMRERIGLGEFDPRFVAPYVAKRKYLGNGNHQELIRRADLRWRLLGR